MRQWDAFSLPKKRFCIEIVAVPLIHIRSRSLSRSLFSLTHTHISSVYLSAHSVLSGAPKGMEQTYLRAVLAA